MIKLSIVSLSGGQGKTTLATLLGRTLAEKGFRTLMVDLDPLHDLTLWLGFNLEEGQMSVLDVINQRVSMQNALYSIANNANIANAEQFWLLPAQENLRDLGHVIQSQREMMPWGSAVTSFQQSLELIQANFDFCIIDTPPQSVGLIEIGLRSADWLMIPAEASLKGCSSLIHTLNLISGLGIDPERLLGVIPFRDRWIGSKRSQESRNAIEFMTEEVGETRILPSFRESEIIKRAINLHTTPALIGEPELEEAIQAILQRIVPQPLPKVLNEDLPAPLSLESSQPEARPSRKSKKPTKKPTKPQASNATTATLSTNKLTESAQKSPKKVKKARGVQTHD